MVSRKLCKRCNEYKDISTFQKSRREKDGLQIWCTPCRTKQQRERKSKYDAERAQILKEQNLDRHLRKIYGISLEDYNNIHLHQLGRCRLCDNPCPSGKRLAVDHCHSTGKVRGLLCVNCNTALGSFKDNLELLKKAVKYLTGELQDEVE
jgi:hypothetical protein